MENYSRGFCIEGFLVKVRNILIATLIISKSETEQEKLSPWKNVFVAQKQLMLMPSNERKKKISSNLKKKVSYSRLRVEKEKFYKREKTFFRNFQGLFRLPCIFSALWLHFQQMRNV